MFISSSIVRRNFYWTESSRWQLTVSLGWRVYLFDFFETWTVFLHCLLDCLVSDERTCALIPYTLNPFYLAVFKFLSLSLVFSNLIVICLSGLLTSFSDLSFLNLFLLIYFSSGVMFFCFACLIIVFYIVEYCILLYYVT